MIGFLFHKRFSPSRRGPKPLESGSGLRTFKGKDQRKSFWPTVQPGKTRTLFRYPSNGKIMVTPATSGGSLRAIRSPFCATAVEEIKSLEIFATLAPPGWCWMRPTITGRSAPPSCVGRGGLIATNGLPVFHQRMRCARGKRYHGIVKTL